MTGSFGLGMRRETRDGASSSDDERTHETRRLVQTCVGDVGDDDSGRYDGGERRSVAFAPDHEPVQTVHAILEPRETGVVGADVLDEEQATVRSEHPVHLTQGTRLVAHPAEH
jgi:hypothetical protein